LYNFLFKRNKCVCSAVSLYKRYDFMIDGEGSFEEFEWEAPIERFEDMLKNKKNWFFDVEDFELLIDYYLDRGNFKKAGIALSFAQGQHPGATSILLRESQVLLTNGKLNKALKILDEIELLEPNSEEVVFIANKDNTKKQYSTTKKRLVLIPKMQTKFY
jgi:tetratricopeptide (TPR) repeat protein